jgi:2-hydroxychromene-2-carboxylate isomerase
LQLKTRHPARQAYHALDLSRFAKHYRVDLKPTPKYYPPKPNTIELAGQAIVRIQNHFGVGSPEALAFSYAVQRCIWITEDGDYMTVEVLQRLAREVGISEEVVERCVIDRRGHEEDEGVRGWQKNHAEAVELGEWFLGQTRRDLLDKPG